MKLKFLLPVLALLGTTSSLKAADYVIDTSGAHASVNLKIKHLGYSWLTARFNQFSGEFSYDAKNVTASKIEVTVDISSFDSNHAKRDKHVKSADFLDLAKFTEAKFVSTSVTEKADGQLAVKGNITIRGITKEIVIDASLIGEGDDPWGGHRAGFSGSTKITMADFGVPTNLGPASADVYFDFHIEGIRKK